MIYCDKCTHEFEIDLKERIVRLAIREAYFKCPQCGEHYTAFYTNQEARRLQRLIMSLSEQGNHVEAYEFKQKLSVIMAELKQQFGA